jgi:uncharacterized membrane protein YgcG
LLREQAGLLLSTGRTTMSIRRAIVTGLLPCTLPLAIAGLLAGKTDPVVRQVKDAAGLFSPAARSQAGAAIKDIKQRYRIDLVIESFAVVPPSQADQLKALGRAKFFSTWAVARAAELKVDGIYILICKTPGHLQIVTGKATQSKAFTIADREKLRDLLISSFRAKAFDKGLSDGIALVRERLEQNLGATLPVAKSKSDGSVFKGKARLSSHACKMEKGNVYQITVKGEGFLPQLIIEGGPTSGTFLNPLSTGPNSLRTRNEAQLIYTPSVTKVYQIKVGFALAADVRQGPLPYTLKIERAVFESQVAVEDRRLEVAEHSRKLEKGKVYGVTVTGKGFAPEVQVVDGGNGLARALHGRWFGFGPDAEFITNLTFSPSQTKEYRIVISAGPAILERKLPLTYTTEVVELKVALSVNEQLTREDPTHKLRGGPHKVHTVKLEAGKSYQIDMMSRAFDSYLFLEDSAGKLLMEDDDGGEGLNARIIFRPAKTDIYRMVATTYNRGRPQSAPGSYTLSVVENPQAQPRFGSPFLYGGGFPDPFK